MATTISIRSISIVAPEKLLKIHNLLIRFDDSPNSAGHSCTIFFRLDEFNRIYLPNEAQIEFAMYSAVSRRQSVCTMHAPDYVCVWLGEGDAAMRIVLAAHKIDIMMHGMSDRLKVLRSIV